jgi:hypothetical protein
MCHLGITSFYFFDKEVWLRLISNKEIIMIDPRRDNALEFSCSLNINVSKGALVKLFHKIKTLSLTFML